MQCCVATAAADTWTWLQIKPQSCSWRFILTEYGENEKKCLQFESETANIVLFSPLQICVSVLVQLTIVLYFVACVLQQQWVGDVVGEVGAGRWNLSLITWTSRTYWACTAASQMHLYMQAQIQVQLQPWWRINIFWLPREWKSNDLIGIISLSPICEQILISCYGNSVSQLISVLKGVCFLDATACCSKNNFSTWCFITLPLIFPRKEQAGSASMCDSITLASAKEK